MSKTMDDVLSTFSQRQTSILTAVEKGEQGLLHSNNVLALKSNLCIVRFRRSEIFGTDAGFERLAFCR